MVVQKYCDYCILFNKIKYKLSEFYLLSKIYSVITDELDGANFLI